MKIKSYKTHKIIPGEDLFKLIDTYILKVIKEKDVLVITSKIVSLAQNRIVSKKGWSNKTNLIRKEADLYLTGNYHKKYGVFLTIKNNILIATAGIDESNGKDIYILWPTDVFDVCAQIWSYIKSKKHLKQLGIIISDSHTVPLRRGVIGIGLGWCGFKALNNYIGQPDIWDKNLCFTKVNTVDALAAAAVYTMGEGNEQTPFTLISQIPHIVFRQTVPTSEEIEELVVPIEKDLYSPLLVNPNWKKAR